MSVIYSKCGLRHKRGLVELTTHITSNGIVATAMNSRKEQILKPGKGGTGVHGINERLTHPS